MQRTGWDESNNHKKPLDPGPVQAMKRTLYEMLGIPPDATSEQIQAAYVARLAALNAPSLQGNEDAVNETRMLREGYQILTDPARKHHYDSVLSNPNSMLRTQVLFMPEGAQRKKLGMQTVVLVIAVLVLAAVVHRHFSKKLEAMDEAHKQAITQQRIDRVPAAQEAPPAAVVAEPLVPLPVAPVPAPEADAGKGQQK